MPALPDIIFMTYDLEYDLWIMNYENHELCIMTERSD